MTCRTRKAAMTSTAPRAMRNVGRYDLYSLASDTTILFEVHFLRATPIELGQVHSSKRIVARRSAPSVKSTNGSLDFMLNGVCPSRVAVVSIESSSTCPITLSTVARACISANGKRTGSVVCGLPSGCALSSLPSFPSWDSCEARVV